MNWAWWVVLWATAASLLVLAFTLDWAVWGVVSLFGIVCLVVSMSNLNPRNKP